MEMQRTIRLKLRPDAAGEASIRRTLAAYAVACNTIRDCAEAGGRKTNYMDLQQRCYQAARTASGLPAQLTVSALRQVAATYKALRARGRDAAPTFRPTSMTLQGGARARDFRLLPGKQVSLSTVDGRVRMGYRSGRFQDGYPSAGWQVASARMVARSSALYLDLALSRPVLAAPLEDRASILGCDLGQNVLATISGPDGACRFFGGRGIKHNKRHYRRVRKSLQAKGTKGAKRTLKRLSGRERRFQRDTNHVTSKRLVTFAGQFERPVIAVEELTGIRQRAKQRKEQRYAFHAWAFAQLRDFLTYKAAAAGIRVEAVDPRNTSKTCSRCGHLADGQRRRLGFQCSACGYRVHADLNAARNIAHRLRVLRQALETPGSPSWTPEVAAPVGASDKPPAVAGGT